MAGLAQMQAKLRSQIRNERDPKADFEGKLTAIGRSQLVVEYDLTGRVLAANAKLLEVFGYRLDEVVGAEHALFVDPGERSDPRQRGRWAKLARGDDESGQYRQLAKGGRELWIQASYDPILGPDGKPYKVVACGADVTAEVCATRARRRGAGGARWRPQPAHADRRHRRPPGGARAARQRAARCHGCARQGHQGGR